MAISFVDGSMVIRDSGTPANNFSGKYVDKLTITGSLPWGASGATFNASNHASIATSLFPFSATAGSVVWRGQKALVTDYFWSLNNDTTNERFTAFVNSGNSALIVTDGGVAQAFFNAGSNAAVTADTPLRLGYAWAANDFAHVKDGGTAGTDASGTLPTPTTLQLAREVSSGSGDTKITSFVYVPRRMTNTELQVKAA